MNIYLLAFCLLPVIGMIGAVVILARDKTVRDHHHSDLRRLEGSRELDVGDQVERTVDRVYVVYSNPTYSFLYRHIVRILSPHFRCIALDYPGFGLSSEGPGYSFKPRQHSDVVEKFVLALGLHEIRLMVQDWGGPIGLGFAGRYPELVHSLFIGNTWAWPAQDVKHMARFSRVVGGPIGSFLIERFNLFVNHLLPNGINRKLSKAEMAAYRGPFPSPKSRRPLAILPREILGSRDYLCEVENGLEGLFDKPVLLLWGTPMLLSRNMSANGSSKSFRER